jgi:glycosyltransferase involved in cell wall biosynthesis
MVDHLGEHRHLLGKKVVRKDKKLKIAMICNWDQECGISTYSKYLVDSLRPKVEDVRIFSEITEKSNTDPNVHQCWERGKSMAACMAAIQQYDPDFVLVQHEFGIFPRAPYLLQMLQQLDHYPYAVVLHSTYEHLDKSVCTAAMRNILVHTNLAKETLRKIGNSSMIQVIPHGCVEFPDRKELWNIFGTKHAIVQFGFGFFYKGVDRAIEAVHYLKTSKPERYNSGTDDIFYCYYCSENGHTKNIHGEYVNSLNKKIDSLGLQDNVVIIKKWNTDQEINNILRTAKLAIFPYLINPGNVVYGASGALRISFANGIPCLASESHLFDEVPGLPRPDNAHDLAIEIDKVFSDWKYKDALIMNQDAYVHENTWDKTTDRYLEAIDEIRRKTTVTVS